MWAETMIMNLYRKVDRTKIQFDFLYMKSDECHYDQEIIDLGENIRINPPRKVGVIRHMKSFQSFVNMVLCAVHAHTLFHSGIVMFAALAGWANEYAIRIIQVTLEQINF